MRYQHIKGYSICRSTYYHRRAQTNEQEVRQAIEAVAAEYPRYGYRWVTHQLRRQGQIVNHKRVERIMRELGLQARRTSKRKVTTNSAQAFPRYPNLVEHLEIVRPDQVWVCDITYIRLLEEFVYLAVLMDVFTRGIRGWHLGRSLDQSLTLRALEQALAQHTPEIHHSDQGVQYAATAYTARLQAAGVQISMAEGYSSRKERRKTARLLMRKFEINCARRPIAIHSLLTTEHFVYNLMGAVQVTMGYTLIPLYTSPCVTTVK